MDFADLLEAAGIPGDFLLRFMTSHPKDASSELLRPWPLPRRSPPCFHLPFQAGERPHPQGHEPGVRPGGIPG